MPATVIGALVASDAICRKCRLVDSQAPRAVVEVHARHEGERGEHEGEHAAGQQQGDQSRAARAAVQQHGHRHAQRERRRERQRQPEVEADVECAAAHGLCQQQLDELAGIREVQRAEHHAHQRDDEQHDVQEAHHHPRPRAAEAEERIGEQREEEAVAHDPAVAQLVLQAECEDAAGGAHAASRIRVAMARSTFFSPVFSRSESSVPWKRTDPSTR